MLTISLLVWCIAYIYYLQLNLGHKTSKMPPFYAGHILNHKCLLSPHLQTHKSINFIWTDIAIWPSYYPFNHRILHCHFFLLNLKDFAWSKVISCPLWKLLSRFMYWYNRAHQPLWGCSVLRCGWGGRGVVKYLVESVYKRLFLCYFWWLHQPRPLEDHTHAEGEGERLITE